MKSIIILGGGGHAKVVISAIESLGTFTIKGILDPNHSVGSKVSGYPVLGTDDLLISKKTDDFLALGIGMMRAEEITRKALYEKFMKLGYQFPALIHQKSVLAKQVNLSAGVQVMAGSIVQPDVTVGENSIINTGAIIEHDSKIGNHCHIAPGAVLGGNVTIGSHSLIGLGAKILPGITIGSNVTVGAGAVVINDIEDSKTVVGNPARERETARK